MHKNNPFSRAFTIVELLIVVTVIAILSAIIYIGYNGIQSKAEVAVITTDLGILADEMQLFYQDHGQYPLVYPAVYGEPLTDLEQILKTTKLFDSTRGPNQKKEFIFCTPTRTNPQRYVIVSRKFEKSATDTSSPMLYYVTSDDSQGSTPMVWTDAITNADPAGKYGSNACNTVSLKTGTSYFATGNMRWSYAIPQIVTY